jgi:hypothetical protein
MVTKLNVVLPYQYHNLVMTFVTILAVLWSLVAIKRVYRALRLRSAVLTDHLVNIRGLGSYLTYFDDAATKSHLDAVVHTRQSMPPVAMGNLAVPLVVKSFDISIGKKGNSLEFQLEMSFSAALKTRIVVMYEYNSANFQKLMQKVRDDLPSSGNRMSEERLLNAITGMTKGKSGFDGWSSGAVFAQAAPRFHLNEVCSFECICQETAAGFQRLTLPLPVVTASSIRDKAMALSEGATENKLSFAVFVLPLHASDFPDSGARSYNKNTSSSSSSGGTSNGSSNTSAAPLLRSAAVGDGSEDSLLNPTGSKPKHPHQHQTIEGTNPMVAAEGGAGAGPPGKALHNLAAGTGTAPQYNRNFNSNHGTYSPPADLGGRYSADSPRASSDVADAAAAAAGFLDSTNSDFRCLAGVPIAAACVFVHTVNLQRVKTACSPTDSTASGAGAKGKGSIVAAASDEKVVLVPLVPTELTVLDFQCNMYQSLEVFGLSSVTSSNSGGASSGDGSSSCQATTRAPTTTAVAGTDTVKQSASAAADAADAFTPESSANNTAEAGGNNANGATSNSTVCTGGVFVKEDCVVCLTDPKQVLLVPCR